jgi:hypothetical protein
MEVTIEVTEEDYIRFNMYHINQSPSQKKLFTILRYMIPIVFSIPIYIIGTEVFQQPSAYWFVIAFIFVIGWILTYPVQYKRSIKRQVKKMLQEGDNSLLFGKKKVRIEEDTMTIVGAHSTETISINNIVKIREYEDMLVVYLSAISAQIIPTRYLDAETQRSLLNLITRK